MAYILADFLTTLPQTLVAGWIVGKYIQAKHQWSFFLLFAFAGIFFYLLFGYIPNPSYTARGVTVMATQMILIASFRRIPLTHAFVFFLLAQLLMFIAEIPLDLILFQVAPDFSTLRDLSLSGLVLVKLIMFPIYSLAFIIPHWFCNRYVRKRGNQEVSKYMPFFVLQAFMVILPIAMFLSISNNYTLISIMAVLYLATNLLLDILLLRTFEKINRAHELELQEEQAQNMLQAQMDYYNQMQDSARTMQQVRHDMKNQLQTLSILLEDGAYDTALEQLSSFREEISRTGKKRFTGNAVVDAVIESKQGACAEQGIELQCSGSLPGDIGVKAISLCGIAANLLDNAIHAAEKLPPEQPRTIHFSANIKAQRVVFSCENPMLPGQQVTISEPEPAQEHGWGLSILRKIAADYQGQLEFQQTEDTVRAVLWLIPEPQETDGEPVVMTTA